MRLFTRAEREKSEFLNHHNYLLALTENDRAGLNTQLSMQSAI